VLGSTGLKELDDDLAAANTAKEAAVANQDFDTASRHRDTADRIRRKKKELLAEIESDCRRPADSSYSLTPVVLYEQAVGDPDGWEHSYDVIARNKALQLWTDRNDDRTSPVPHLLFSGDTPYWGGVKRRGIVVACSGVQSWFDKLISGIVADTIVALAHHAYENDEAAKSPDFLS
jgi:hypothetical protein